jgi:hypothetical protein
MVAKVTLSVKEALVWVRLIKKLTDQRRHYTVSVWAEDIEEMLTAKVKPTPAALERLCQRYCPSGRRGHMTMVLRDPYDARALGCLVGIIRAIDASELSTVEPEPGEIPEPPPPTVKKAKRRKEVVDKLRAIESPELVAPLVEEEPPSESEPTSDVSAWEEQGLSGEELARRALLGELD